MTKTIFTLIFLGIVTYGYALPRTYVYRLDINRNSTLNIKTTVASIEIKGSGQPYQNTSILMVADTNYLLVPMTPKDGLDFKLESKAIGVTLYQVLELGEDGFFRKPIDNSALFPVNKDWSKVEISTT